VRPRDFTMQRALERIEQHGDLFAPVLEDPRPLSPAAKALDRLYD
jgi:DNA primase